MIPVIKDSNNSDAEVVAYNPTSSSSTIPITQNRSRRSSILDISGDDTINNFASSLKRSVNYLSTSLESPKPKAPNSPNLNTPSSPLISALEQRFLANENTPLLTSQLANISDSDLMDSNTFVTANSTLSTSEAGLPKTRKSSFISSIKSNAGACDIVEEVSYPEFIDKAIPHKSTPIQTIFNSINVLIGLGILSLPLALHLSGWIPGFICITLAAYSTRYSAILLGRILKEIPYLKTYHDIGVHVYGPKIGFFILISFTVDLFGAGVSMIILFSDSFNALFPQLSQVFLKVLVTIIMLLLNFLPLRILSVFSLLGIICTTSTCVTILVAGLIKTALPGSLLHPMPTNLFPQSILDFCFALGLYLAPWGGHATFPEIYSDQSHPETYDSCMNYSFSFSYLIDFLTGVLGFLMFGKVVDDEITRNILTTEGYPGWIGSFIVILMGLLPISKLPLVSRPLLTAMDTFSSTENQELGIARKTLHRLLLSSVFLCISLMVSSFGKVMSLLGSAICFTVCITLPIFFYLRVFKSELRKTHTFVLITMAIISILCTLCGSVAVIVK